MKETIRQRALELGFDDCRFTTGDGPGTADRFQNWLAGGRHGEMSWLERTAPKRVDPQKVLPGAKGIIVLAANYGTKVEGHDSERPLTRPSATLSPPGGERGILSVGAGTRKSAPVPTGSARSRLQYGQYVSQRLPVQARPYRVTRPSARRFPGRRDSLPPLGRRAGRQEAPAQPAAVRGLTDGEHAWTSRLPARFGVLLAHCRRPLRPRIPACGWRRINSRFQK